MSPIAWSSSFSNNKLVSSLRRVGQRLVLLPFVLLYSVVLFFFPLSFIVRRAFQPSSLCTPFFSPVFLLFVFHFMWRALTHDLPVAFVLSSPALLFS